jgi:hypothetical protein
MFFVKTPTNRHPSCHAGAGRMTALWRDRKTSGHLQKNTKRSKKSQALGMTSLLCRQELQRQILDPATKLSSRPGKLRRSTAHNHRWGPSTSRHNPLLSNRPARRFAPAARSTARRDRRGRQDDGFVEGLKNIWSSAKNTKRSKKSQALRMTILIRTRMLKTSQPMVKANLDKIGRAQPTQCQACAAVVRAISP